jgi:hypothetical protein
MIDLFLIFMDEGVEHLLRDVKDATVSTLSTDVASKLQALKGLKGRLQVRFQNSRILVG